MAAATYDALVFGGGGTLVPAHIGALAELEARGAVRLGAGGATRRFAGTSIGAAVAGLLACGASVPYLQRVLRQWDARVARDSAAPAWLTLPLTAASDLWRFYQHGGVWSGARMREWYADRVAELTGARDTTFAQAHARYGTELVVCAYCVDDDATVYFSHRTHPRVPVATAVAASMAVPGLFQWVTCGDNGDRKRYWDGGLIDNVPVHAFDARDERTGARTACHAGTLALKFTSDDAQLRANAAPVRNVADAAPRLVRSVVALARRAHQHACDYQRTVSINVRDMDAFDLDLNDDKKARLVRYGRDAVRAYLQRRATLAATTTRGSDDDGRAPARTVGTASTSLGALALRRLHQRAQSRDDGGGDCTLAHLYD